MHTCLHPFMHPCHASTHPSTHTFIHERVDIPLVFDDPPTFMGRKDRSHRLVNCLCCATKSSLSHHGAHGEGQGWSKLSSSWPSIGHSSDIATYLVVMMSRCDFGTGGASVALVPAVGLWQIATFLTIGPTLGCLSWVPFDDSSTSAETSSPSSPTVPTGPAGVGQRECCSEHESSRHHTRSAMLGGDGDSC